MTSFKLALATALGAALAFSPAAFAQEKSGGKAAPKVSKQDRQAMQKLAQSDMAEIEAGKLAQQKASSPEVKKFGEHMVEEHSKMLEEGKALAQSKGVKPPAATDKKHQAALKKLQGASGDDFDRRYMAQMVEDHQDALKLAEKAAKDAKDPQLKQHAQKGAGHIKEHLAQARKLYSGLAASAGSSRPAKKQN